MRITRCHVLEVASSFSLVEHVFETYKLTASDIVSVRLWLYDMPSSLFLGSLLFTYKLSAWGSSINYVTYKPYNHEEKMANLLKAV